MAYRPLTVVPLVDGDQPTDLDGGLQSDHLDVAPRHAPVTVWRALRWASLGVLLVAVLALLPAHFGTLRARDGPGALLAAADSRGGGGRNGPLLDLMAELPPLLHDGMLGVIVGPRARAPCGWTEKFVFACMPGIEAARCTVEVAGLGGGVWEFTAAGLRVGRFVEVTLDDVTMALQCPETKQYCSDTLAGLVCDAASVGEMERFTAREATSTLPNVTTTTRTHTRPGRPTTSTTWKNLVTATAPTKAPLPPLLQVGDIVSLIGGRSRMQCGVGFYPRLVCQAGMPVSDYAWEVLNAGSELISLKPWAASNAQPFGPFSVVRLGPDTVALQSDVTGRFCSDDSGGFVCDRTHLAEGEAFTIVGFTSSTTGPNANTSTTGTFTTSTTSTRSTTTSSRTPGAWLGSLPLVPGSTVLLHGGRNASPCGLGFYPQIVCSAGLAAGRYAFKVFDAGSGSVSLGSSFAPTAEKFGPFTQVALAADLVALRSVLTAGWCSDMLLGVQCTAAAIGPWEQFRVQVQDPAQLKLAGSMMVLPIAQIWQQALGTFYWFADSVDSSLGATRVCLPSEDPDKVDIGMLSRPFLDSEAAMLSDGSTFRCLSSQVRVSQVSVAVDALVVVVARGGPADECLTILGGLSLAQLHWLFWDAQDSALAAELDMGTVVPNNDGDGVREWSDFAAACPHVPVTLYGPARDTGHSELFGRVVSGNLGLSGQAVTGDGLPECGACEVVTVGASESNVKRVPLPRSGLQCRGVALNLQRPEWSERFSVGVRGAELEVTLSSASGGWSQYLQIPCCRQACEVVTVGASDSNVKRVPLPRAGLQCSGTPLNQQGDWRGESFSATADGAEVEVIRTNSSGGWGQDLQIACCQQAWSNARQRPNCYMPSSAPDYAPQVANWLLQDPAGVAFMGLAGLTPFADSLSAAPLAADRRMGAAASAQAKVVPATGSVADGSYALRQELFMMVDVSAWPRVRPHLNYGLSSQGQWKVAEAGLAPLGASQLSAMRQVVAGGGASVAGVDCVFWWRVALGDTCWRIWGEAGLSEEHFRRLNPGVDCDALLESQLVCRADTRVAPPPSTVLCRSRASLIHGGTCQEVASRYELTMKALRELNPGLKCGEALQTGVQLCVAAEVLRPEDDFSSPLNPERAKAMDTAASLLSTVDPGLRDLVRRLSEVPSEGLNQEVGARLADLLARPGNRAVAQEIEDILGPQAVERAVVPHGSLEVFCSGLLGDPGSAGLEGAACLCARSAPAAREPLLYCAALLFRSFGAGSAAASGAEGGAGGTAAGSAGGGAAAAAAGEDAGKASGGAGLRRLAAAGGVTDEAAEMVGEFFSMVEQAEQKQSWLSKILSFCEAGGINLGQLKDRLKSAAGSSLTPKASKLGSKALVDLSKAILSDEIQCGLNNCVPIAGVVDLCFFGGLVIPNFVMASFRVAAQLVPVICGMTTCIIADRASAADLFLKAMVEVRSVVQVKVCPAANMVDKLPLLGFIKEAVKELCITIFEASWYMAKGLIRLTGGATLSAFGLGLSATVSASVKAYHPDAICRNRALRCEDFCRMRNGQAFGELKVEAKFGWFGSASASVYIPQDRGGLPECQDERDLLWQATKEALESTNASQFLQSEQPDGSWAPSTTYHWPDLQAALEGMYKKGVDGKTFWLGDGPDDWKYGMVSVAAFLGQSMAETIRYDACDENNWDQTSNYASTNACGQGGQSYQDYKCPAGQEQYQCAVDPNMQVRAATHAKWYGAPPGFFCAPRSKLREAPRWSHLRPWCDPATPREPIANFEDYLRYIQTYGQENCRDYAGQRDGLWELCGGAGCPNAAAPAFGRPARSDVEGCCWWGRGVIQTTGVCNFGKLNFFLGARAAREGRPALFPSVDFCSDPEAICTSAQHPELKWVAGLYFFMSEVQSWNDSSWSYLEKLKAFVGAGVRRADTDFIDGVSGIVNRGCPSAVACKTGPVHSVEQRLQNFWTVLSAMGLAAPAG